MRLARALQDKLMDVRLRDKLLAEGKVTKEEVQEYLSSLPDDFSNAIFTDEVKKNKEAAAAAAAEKEASEIVE